MKVIQRHQFAAFGGFISALIIFKPKRGLKFFNNYVFAKTGVCYSSEDTDDNLSWMHTSPTTSHKIIVHTQIWQVHVNDHAPGEQLEKYIQ